MIGPQLRGRKHYRIFGLATIGNKVPGAKVSSFAESDNATASTASPVGTWPATGRSAVGVTDMQGGLGHSGRGYTRSSRS